MSGPWYQISGPDPKQVRMDQLKKGIKKYKLENKQWHIGSYNHILKEVITDDIKFGSWRGYATFGIESKLNRIQSSRIEIESNRIESIRRDLERERCKTALPL